MGRQTVLYGRCAEPNCRVQRNNETHNDQQHANFTIHHRNKPLLECFDHLRHAKSAQHPDFTGQGPAAVSIYGDTAHIAWIIKENENAYASLEL